MTLRTRFTAIGIAVTAAAALTACSSQDSSDATTAATTTVKETVAGAPAGDDQAAQDSPQVSREDALAKAYAQAGVQESDVSELEQELDDGDDGFGPHWEIEFKANGQEHEFDVDAATGEVRNHEID
ncbi:PepSY domain-containing protein [Corynebacterium sp.]|uniref:PepSY domain-containing protein n=1 Tax=Corynebacterium sp. TaxID=1720 RepID=UPI0025D6988E|nr:PepSY domain-containing protein [Corynebacterium sp.]